MSFPKDFYWGVSSAAVQIEGAWNEDGKVPSVWDELPEGKIAHNETPRIACDHYHRYKEDVAWMAKLGVKSYRFSISWSRIVPYRGVRNEKGLEFYNNLVDELLAHGIEPMITLNHSDMPIWVRDMGGWDNDETAEAFAEYTEIVVSALSDRVRWWFTFNEPQCIVTDFTGQTPSGDEKRGTRGIMLAHGKAVQTIRRVSKQPAKVGIVIMGICLQPIPGVMDEETAKNVTFSDMARSMGMSWWMDPLILGKVPAPLQGVLSEEDMKTICQPLDFYGVNGYFPANYSERPGRPNPAVRPGLPRSQIGGVVSGEIIYWISKFCYERYHLPILITENGLCDGDWVSLDGKVHDPRREDYIHRYLIWLKRAIDEGIPVLGYLYWSIMDNFEWSFGYDVRFGLLFVDYLHDLRRIPKDSFYYYQHVIETNGADL